VANVTKVAIRAKHFLKKDSIFRIFIAF